MHIYTQSYTQAYVSRQVHDKRLHELKLKMHKLYKVTRASNPSFIT